MIKFVSSLATLAGIFLLIASAPLNGAAEARTYDPTSAGVDLDLQESLGPFEPVLARLDPKLKVPIALTDDEFRQLVDFVRNGLLDSRAKPEHLRKLIPARVPSGRRLQVFQ